MSNDIELYQPVVHPVTGELLDLQVCGDDQLGQFLAEVRDYESRLREAKRAVTREALRRMDASASWTLRAGSYTLKGASPTPVEEWDATGLLSALWGLQDEGLITEDAVNAAVETVVTHKVRKAGVNALRKLGGRIADTVDLYSQEREKDRYVSVTVGSGR